MQSENFDKKVRDSLSQRPPGNDDPRWDKMERLLDEHMPREKRDNRRLLIILFLFLLLGGGAFIIWKNNNGDKQTISSIDPQNKNPEQGETSKNNSSTSNLTPDTGTTIADDKVIDQLPKENHVKNDQQSLQQETRTSNKKYPDPKENPQYLVTDAAVTKTKKDKIVTDQVKDNNNVIAKELDPANKPEKIAGNENIQKQNEPTKDKEAQNLIPENKPVEKNAEAKNELTTPTKKPESKKQKKGSSFANNFFFTLSAGPDYSMVKFDGGGKVKLAKGVGIGYQVSDRFSIRTGFYSARKVYYADPEDYDPPAAFWAWYPNLESINANCKVYEIPVTIDYTFSRNKKQSWFASAGVSSLIMKEETYDYYFKPNYSPTYVTYTKTYNNENKHLFSVLNLSGGYKRNINKNFSLQAEPYVKFAMGGVGYGKVKLNSGGVLISAVIKPFAKK